MVNIAGEPRRAFLTFVSFSKSYAFRGEGSGIVLDTSGVDYVTAKPNADEWECAMGFLTGTTQLHDHSISEYQRKVLLGQAMDLNCLTWMLAIAMDEQSHLKTTVLSMPSFPEMRAALHSLPHSGMDVDVTGGEG